MDDKVTYPQKHCNINKSLKMKFFKTHLYAGKRLTSLTCMHKNDCLMCDRHILFFNFKYKVDWKQFISVQTALLAWIIINNLLHKINHHSKNHTSALDQKSVMAKKNPSFQVPSVWLCLYWPRIPDPWGVIAPHHSFSSAPTTTLLSQFSSAGGRRSFLWQQVSRFSY